MSAITVLYIYSAILLCFNQLADHDDVMHSKFCSVQVYVIIMMPLYGNNV